MDTVNLTNLKELIGGIQTSLDSVIDELELKTSITANQTNVTKDTLTTLQSKLTDADSGIKSLVTSVRAEATVTTKRSDSQARNYGRYENSIKELLN